jgi:hypothetical protein
MDDRVSLQQHMKRGILFEEDIIVRLLKDIEETSRFEGIQSEKRERILPLLREMIEDSRRHKALLEEILKKG